MLRQPENGHRLPTLGLSGSLMRSSQQMFIKIRYDYYVSNFRKKSSYIALLLWQAEVELWDCDTKRIYDNDFGEITSKCVQSNPMNTANKSQSILSYYFLAELG